MKEPFKLVTLAMAFVATVSLSACKSGETSNDNSNTASTEAAAEKTVTLIGQWEAYALSNDGKSWTELSDETVVMDFREDGTYTQTEMVTVYDISATSDGSGRKERNSEKGNWKLDGKTLSLGKFESEVVSLDKEELIVTFKNRYIKYRRVAE